MNALEAEGFVLLGGTLDDAAPPGNGAAAGAKAPVPGGGQDVGECRSDVGKMSVNVGECR